MFAPFIATPEAVQPKARLRIVDAHLHVMCFEPSTQYAKLVQNGLDNNGPVLYHFEQWSPFSFVIPSGQSYWQCNDVSTLVRPLKVYVVFVAQSAADGNFNKYEKT